MATPPFGLDDVTFEEAVAWFRERIPMTDAEFAAIVGAAREKAFTVAGVAQLDVVTQVWEAVDRALEQGTDLAAFKEAVAASVEAAWAGSVGDPAWRLETIFRTNVQLAYSAGRHAQMTDPVVLEARPYWLYDAILDGRTTAVCSACDGTIRPANDPWWGNHHPPLHFNCRSAVTTLSEDQARDMGITPRAPSIGPEEGFGTPPAVAPTWAPTPSDYPAPLWNEHERKRTGT